MLNCICWPSLFVYLCLYEISDNFLYFYPSGSADPCEFLLYFHNFASNFNYNPIQTCMNTTLPQLVLITLPFCIIKTRIYQLGSCFNLERHENYGIITAICTILELLYESINKGEFFCLKGLKKKLHRIKVALINTFKDQS